MKAPQADWAELVQRAQAGDGDAFTELFHQLHTPVLNYIYRTVGDRATAEDVTQDAFIRAHQRIDQLGPPYDFKSWVFRIASNLAIDILRQSKRYVDLEEPMEPLGPMTTKRPAERKVQRAQARRSVQDTLALMPTTYRQAIVLRELNGLAYQEVANALECSYDSARQLVHRARLRFRELHGIRLLATSGAIACRQLDDLISAMQDGELTRENQKAVRKHIRSCEHCKETEKDLRKVAGLVAGLVPILPSSEWVQAIETRIQAQSPQVSPPQPGPVQGQPPAGSAISGAGSTAPGMGWLAKLGIGAVIALIGAGALIAAGAWAFNRIMIAPSEADPESVAATVRAIVDLTPPTPTQDEKEATEEPANLPPPLVTPTPTESEAENPPGEQGPPIAVALVNSNCRSGPGGIYAILDYLLEDEQTPIVGRDAQWFWWVVEKKNAPGTCWVANNLTDELGDTSQVPVVPIPPTPTPADTTGPTLSLSHTPVNPLSNQVVTFEVNASDPSGVAWIEIWLRAPGQSVATRLGTCTSTNVCSLFAGPFPAGQGQYFARAEDSRGNFVESNVILFDVNWYIG